MSELLKDIDTSAVTEELQTQFMAQCDELLADMEDAGLKEALIDLAKRAAPTYLKYAQCIASGEEVPLQVSQLIQLFEAELSQYRAIASMKFNNQLKAFASTAIAIVAAAVIKYATSGGGIAMPSI